MNTPQNNSTFYENLVQTCTLKQLFFICHQHKNYYVER